MNPLPTLVAILAASALAGACGGAEAPCMPSKKFCRGNEVRFCNSTGEGSTHVGDCEDGRQCIDGACTAVAFPDARDEPDPSRDVAPDASTDLPRDEGPADPGGIDHGGTDTGHEDVGKDVLPDPGEDPGTDPGVADPGPDVPGPTDPGGPDDGGTADPGFDVPRDPGPLDPGPLDPGGDVAPDCGNGKIEPGEECDRANLGGATCASLKLGLSGTPGCLDDCRFDTLPCGGHSLGYTPVKNLLVSGGFVDVAWHPDGSYALLVARGGEVVKFDAAGGNLSLVGDTGTTSPAQVAFAPSGVAYVVGAISEGAGRVFRVPDGAGSVEAVAGGDSGAARWVAIEFPRAGGPAVLVGYANTQKYYETGYIATWDPADETLQGFKGFSTGAGVSDFTFVEDPTLLSVKGYAGLIPCGANGVDALLQLETGNIVTSGSLAGYGNMGRAAWRPGGAYGLVSGTSSAILYVFDGAWSKAYLNTQQAGSSVHGVFFRDDGRRGLVLGASFGGTAHVLDHRPSGTAFSASDLVPQPLDGWNDSPWFADDASLNAGAFRPRVACDEGLLVGEGPGPAWNPGLALVVRFRDTDPHDCPP